MLIEEHYLFVMDLEIIPVSHLKSFVLLSNDTAGREGGYQMVTGQIIRDGDVRCIARNGDLGRNGRFLLGVGPYVTRLKRVSVILP